jgi:hypothetical protein
MVEFNPPAEVVNNVQIQSVMSENAIAKTFEPIAPQVAVSEPTAAPVVQPTMQPTAEPTSAPTAQPTMQPTAEPTSAPTAQPTAEPKIDPTAEPKVQPTTEPTAEPTTQPPVQPEVDDAFLRDCAKAYGVDVSEFGLHRLGKSESEHNNETVYSLSEIPAEVLAKSYIAVDLTLFKKDGKSLGNANRSNMDFGELPRNFCVRLSAHEANNFTFKKNCNDARVIFLKLEHKDDPEHQAFESITQCSIPEKENKKGESFSKSDDAKDSSSTGKSDDGKESSSSSKKDGHSPQKIEEQISSEQKVVNKTEGQDADVLTVTPPRKPKKK